ncbi:MAG TPA: PKD domain-containing protein [Candidatus Andersenbacteria bacterium]|nr:PKD domain-containing protein [Candidatus Andersenbacteria bacterium]
MRISILLCIVCILFVRISFAHADDFDEDSEVEPTTPVTGYSIKLSQTPEPVLIPELPENIAPRANAGIDQVVNAGALVVLDATMSKDIDGTIASYVWKQLSGPTAELLSSRTNHPSFFAGNNAASYVFQLTVKDSGGYSAIDVVTIVVRQGLVVSPSPVITAEALYTPTPQPITSSFFSVSNTLLIALAGVLLVLIIAVIKVVFTGG